jgi:hypothetical protein
MFTGFNTLGLPPTGLGDPETIDTAELPKRMAARAPRMKNPAIIND